MSKITIIPDNNHVTRYVPYKKQKRNFQTEALEGILGDAFSLRPKDNGAASVTWIEYFGVLSDISAKAAFDAYRKSQKSQTLSKNAIFAIGNVGMIKMSAKEAGHSIRVLLEASTNNPAHATIRRVPIEDLGFLEALATEVFLDLREKDGTQIRL